jgi:lipid-binding SYLF domain-containing protein
VVRSFRIARTRFAMACSTMFLFSAQGAMAASAAEINRDVNSELRKLYKKTPAAKELSKVAKGILIFPTIVKG